jgi:aminoglycoside phosphotransferase family enzyme/predicted kinase
VHVKTKAGQPQRDVIDWLTRPSTHGGRPVERIDTHSAVVFLAGERALKLKRAVTYDYLDFSTESLRHQACDAEVRINRRAAPSIYRGVIPVTRERDGSLALDGAGPAVDWLVEMARFDQEGLLDRLAARGALDLDLMAPLASAIAEFHRTADRRDDQGGVAGMRWVIDGNARGFTEQGLGILDQNAAAELTTRSLAELDRQAERLERRRKDGFVRQCHGDLHLRNLVLLDGRPTLFDAVEFNDHIACGDVFYDLAFLLMDLWRRDLRRHANTVLNAYVTAADDLDGLALLPLFLSCRAAVRAKTSVSSARVQESVERRGEFEALARRYLAVARDFLDPPPPQLVAVGGLSGSGKTTLARALAADIGAVPGAVILRSDEIRKAVCGVGPLERLGQSGYTAGVTSQVYRTVAERAARTLASGHSAVADAVYGRANQRSAIESVATSAGVPFVGLWLDAPEPVLVTRVTGREADASDADAEVVRRQLEQDPGNVTWHRVDASTSPEDVHARARSLCAGSHGGNGTHGRP